MRLLGPMWKQQETLNPETEDVEYQTAIDTERIVFAFPYSTRRQMFAARSPEVGCDQRPN
jgi:hypothetical protein